jgi:hypothetical protein
MTLCSRCMVLASKEYVITKGPDSGEERGYYLLDYGLEETQCRLKPLECE